MLFVNVILPVFLLAFVGFFFERKTKPDMATLANATLYLFAPALVFSSLLKQTVEFDIVGKLALFTLLYTGILCIAAYLIARMRRFDDGATRALALTAPMINVGNFGLPLVFFAYGEGALDISIVIFVLFNIPLGTLAVYIAQGNGANWRQALLNTAKIPIFHSIVLAFLCKGFDLYPPEFLLRATELLGQAAIPTMLILLGMQLARSSVRDSWGFFTLATSLRLIAGPLLAIALTAILELDGLTRKVVILQTSTPSAVMPLLYAVRFNTRPDLVSGAILLSTLCSAFTLTFLLYWLG